MGELESHIGVNLW